MRLVVVLRVENTRTELMTCYSKRATLFSDERTQEAPSRRLRKALGLVDPNPVPSQLQENTYFHLQDICICSFLKCGLLHLLIFARNFCSL